MTEKQRWMPVFMIGADRTEIAAFHPDEKKSVAPTRIDEDLIRIGTAHLRDDGSYLISLLATPLDGRLVIREPSEHDKASISEGAR